MTNITHQSTNEIGEFQTHLCLISDQSAANFLPIVYFKPKNVVFVVTKEKREAARAMRDALKNARPGIQIDELEIDSANDVNSTLIKIWECLDTYKEKKLKPIVNLTGGTKPMAIAALHAASSADCPAFYLDREKNVITIFHAGTIDSETQLPAIEFKPKLEHYLAAYGYIPKKRAKVGEHLSGEKLVLVRELAIKSEIREAIPFMNKFVCEAADNHNRTKGLGQALKETGNAGLRAGVEAWIREFEKVGCVVRKGDELEFPNEESRFFAAGGWMEEFVALRLRELGITPEVNLEIKKGDKYEKGDKNEIDAAFLYKDRPFVIECKTSMTSKIDVANQYVYKLEALAKVGGLNTKLVLISYQKVHKKAKQRARNNGIAVIDGEQILNLKEKLREVIQ